MCPQLYEWYFKIIVFVYELLHFSFVVAYVKVEVLSLLRHVNIFVPLLRSFPGPCPSFVKLLTILMSTNYKIKSSVVPYTLHLKI